MKPIVTADGFAGAGEANPGTCAGNAAGSNDANSATIESTRMTGLLGASSICQTFIDFA